MNLHYESAKFVAEVFSQNERDKYCKYFYVSAFDVAFLG